MLEIIESIIQNAKIENASSVSWSRGAIYQLHKHLNNDYKLINFLIYWINTSTGLIIDNNLHLLIRINEDQDVTLSNDQYLALEFNFWNDETSNVVVVRYIY